MAQSYVIKSFVVISFWFYCGNALPAFSQQPEWLAALQGKLSGFSLTRPSKDGTNIVKPGTKFVLKTGGMGVALAVPGRLLPQVWSNTYVNGAIKPNFPFLLERQVENGTATRLPAGEKVWVTNLVPRKNEIDLVMVTDLFRLQSRPGVLADQMSVAGRRFLGELKFPIPKNTQPDADQIYASMLQVLAPEDSSPAAFCDALVKLKSTVLSTILDDTVLPNGEPPDEPGMIPNTETYHLEAFTLRGDQTKSIHAAVQSCLSTLTLSKRFSLEDGFYRSTLSGYDAPFDISFDVSSRLETDGDTLVRIAFNRLENEAQLRLDHAAVAYVALAVETCGWRLQTRAQTENINRLLSNRSKWFQEELDSANRHVTETGRLDFCSDPKEKTKFDRLVPMLWPVGTAGRP